MFKIVFFLSLTILLFTSCKKHNELDETEYTFTLESEIDYNDSPKLQSIVKELASEYLIKTGKPKISEFKLVYKGWYDDEKTIYRIFLFHPSDNQSSDVGGGKSLSLRINFKLYQIRELRFQ